MSDNGPEMAELTVTALACNGPSLQLAQMISQCIAHCEKENNGVDVDAVLDFFKTIRSKDFSQTNQQEEQ